MWGTWNLVLILSPPHPPSPPLFEQHDEGRAFPGLTFKVFRGTAGVWKRAELGGRPGVGGRGTPASGMLER